MANDGETVETVADFIFWAPKSLQMVTAAMKLKDTYSLEGLMLNLKLWILPHFGHLMQRANSLGKTMMLGKIAGRRRGDRKSTRLNSSHRIASRMPSSA